MTTIVTPADKIAEVDHALRSVRDFYNEACGSSDSIARAELARRIFVLETIYDDYRWIIEKQRTSKCPHART